MTIAVRHTTDEPANPLDVLEELVSGNGWTFNRHSDSELMVEVGGRWCGYPMFFVWQTETNALFFSCQLDLRLPETRQGEVHHLVAAMNESLWLGHFDVVAQDRAIMFRHTVPLRGAVGLSPEQLEDLVDAAVAACERFYPAVQMVIWGGHSVADALSVARMDTAGEA